MIIEKLEIKTKSWEMYFQRDSISKFSILSQKQSEFPNLKGN